MSKYYYHGCDLDVMVEIMQSGGIKTQRELGYSEGRGFNGFDYVSVCNKLNEWEYMKPHSDDAYTSYIKNQACFIISNEIEAIKTQLLDGRALNWNYSRVQQYIKEHSNYRWSDMIDEYQVKGSIPLKHIVGIGLPLSVYDNQLKKYGSQNSVDTLAWFERIFASDIMNKLKQVKNTIEIAKELNLDIVNTNEPNFIDNYEKKYW